MPPAELPKHHDEIAAFVAAFEDGTLPKARWTHAAHILTGAWYVHGLGEEAAICQDARGGEAVQRGGGREEHGDERISRDDHGVLDQGACGIAAAEFGGRSGEFALHAVERLGTRRGLHEAFYGFDVVASEQARREWIEPARAIEGATL